MGDLQTPSDIHHKSLDTVETGTSERGCQASGLKAKLKQSLGFCAIATGINFFTVAALLVAHPDLQVHMSSFHLVICDFLAFSSLICGITLMAFIQYLLSHENPCVQRGHYRAAIFHVFISCALLISTSASLFPLLHEHSIYLVALLPPCLFFGTIFYIIMQAIDDQGARGYEDNKSELKQSFGLSSSVVSPASAGLIGTLAGISKTSSKQAPTTNMFVCTTLMVMAFLFGLILMLLSSAPPKLERQSHRECLIKVLKALSYALLGLLAAIAATAASAFLEVYLVLVLFLVPFLGLTVWFSLEHCAQKQQPRQCVDTGDHKFQIKLVSKVATTTTSISFGGVMAFYSGFLSSEPNKFWLKLIVFFMLLAFVVSLIVMLLTCKTPKAGTQITVVNILNNFSILLLALAAMAAYFLEVLGN